MKKKSFFNPFLVLLFPILTIVFIPIITNYYLVISARTFHATAFWVASISWIIIGIFMALITYRITIYSDKSDTFTKWITIIWTLSLILLLLGSYLGYSHFIYITLSLYGTFFVELTAGFYLSLTVILLIKK